MGGAFAFELAFNIEWDFGSGWADTPLTAIESGGIYSVEWRGIYDSPALSN